LISQIPIESHWEITVPYRATLNFQAFLLSHAALDLFLDIVILCFPLPVISSLHMKTGRKIALVGIFWLGALYDFTIFTAFILHAHILAAASLLKPSASTTLRLFSKPAPSTSPMAFPRHLSVSAPRVLFTMALHWA
jgi:hypothetical protein